MLYNAAITQPKENYDGFGDKGAQIGQDPVGQNLNSMWAYISAMLYTLHEQCNYKLIKCAITHNVGP